jgi:ribonuclease G
MVFSYRNTKMGISENISDQEERQRLKSIFESRKLETYGLILRTNAANIPEKELLIEFENGERQFLTLIQNQNHRTCYSILYHSPSPFLELIRDIAIDSPLEIITDDMDIYQEIETSDFLLTHRNAILRLYEDPSFSLAKLYCLETKLKDALSKKVWLPSGGYLVIEQTEAMVVIDVNSVKFSGKKSKEETFFFINSEAAKEIARQIRLRNLSGILMIDFINMKEASMKQELIHTLKNYVSRDKVKTVVVDITSLGLVEVTRKKIRKTLAEQVFQAEEVYE